VSFVLFSISELTPDFDHIHFFLSGPVNQYLSGNHSDTVVVVLMKALLALEVEPTLALQGYDISVRWDKCLFRLLDYLKRNSNI
jgi:hypothetical protein